METSIISNAQFRASFGDIIKFKLSGSIWDAKILFPCQEIVNFLKVKTPFYVDRFLGTTSSWPSVARFGSAKFG